MKWFLRWVYLLLSILVICAIASLGGCQDGNFLTPPVQTIGATLNSAAADREPNYSYDGRYLIFTSDRHSQRTILLYDVQQRRLVDLPGLNQANVLQEQPDISADGRYIVYISEQFGRPDVFLYDRQTMASHRLTKNILWEIRHPTISGNGRFVAFEANRSGQWDIEIYDRGASVDQSLPSDYSGKSDENAPSSTPVPGQ